LVCLVNNETDQIDQINETDVLFDQTQFPTDCCKGRDGSF